MKAIGVGLLGFGTVGSDVYRILKRNEKEISRRTGQTIAVKAIACRELAAAKNIIGNDAILLTNDLKQVVDSPEVDIVVELIGGLEPAYEMLIRAIAKDKHIVTANKALLAHKGNEIFLAAEKAGAAVGFEAAVAGGIPIIKTLREGLTGNKINWIAGIINGTTNYILSEMRAKGIDFGTALSQAQQLGFAEADPTFDIEGIDAAHKLTLLTSIAFGVPVQFANIYCEGITKLTELDMKFADRFGYCIKLLGITKMTVQGIEARVHPTLIPQHSILANVNGAMNAVMVQSDALGPSAYYGQGAGGEPTASAVIADIVDVTRLLQADSDYLVPHLAFQDDALQYNNLLTIGESITSYYLRLQVTNEPGVLAKIAWVLASNNISVDALIQEQSEVDKNHSNLVLLTYKHQEKQFQSAFEQLAKLDIVVAPIVHIRKENLSEIKKP